MPSIVWSDPSTSSPFSPETLDLPTDQQSALLEACSWLEEQLATGPCPAKRLLADASQAGFSRDTLYKARRTIHVHSRKAARDQPYYWGIGRNWNLPSDALDPVPGVCPESGSRGSNAN